MSEFKRDAYFELEDMLSNSNVVFLLGPRKTGKTTILEQMEKSLPNAVLTNFKKATSDESMSVIEQITLDILSGTEKLHLLDEVTYAFFPEEEIAKIAESYTEAKQKGVDVKTKVVLTGSQSVALEAWGRRAFCNQARFLSIGFLSYSEWLKFKSRDDVSAESYADFVQGTSEFYKFTTIEDYLKGCLEETVTSNANSRNVVYGNDCELVDVDVLKDILYISMFTLHDNPSAASFFASRNFSNKMVYLSKQIAKENPLSSEEVRRRVAYSFVSRYDNVQSTNLEVLKQSFAFLMRCGLISATPVFADRNQDNENVLKNLERIDSPYKKKSDLLGRINFTINYPMFFVEIVKEILKDSMPSRLQGTFVGSITECYLRGLLSRNGVYEYHDEQDREIDYVNRPERLAIEFTVSNKDLDRVHLDLIPSEEGYRKILLTKDIRDSIGDVERIPYYEFVYGLTSGRGLGQGAPFTKKTRLQTEFEEEIEKE